MHLWNVFGTFSRPEYYYPFQEITWIHSLWKISNFSNFRQCYRKKLDFGFHCPKNVVILQKLDSGNFFFSTQEKWFWPRCCALSFPSLTQKFCKAVNSAKNQSVFWGTASDWCWKKGSAFTQINVIVHNFWEKLLVFIFWEMELMKWQFSLLLIFVIPQVPSSRGSLIFYFSPDI